ncbi:MULTISPECIES: flagellar basal body-associated protein FliL [Helicobacter]|uniref:Flagellar protein FliL n=1 Tax=Helicobacter ibis TaxID=2962633 RepID=A0ABT4VE45_9HELI|nr:MULTISPECIES: flagellar basal body-associated protein FliL [Helicobacter]MDA3966409.1 flagellar basal body-associated protein FliL [Helicobacter sp. WB40]MDA3968976.1 flagellar basal body-associated protein FliL [Helicobacter ibis]
MAEEEQESKESKLSALKQNKMILFVIIGVVVLLLIVLILVAVLIFSGGNEEEMQAQATAPTEQLQSASNRGSAANPNSSLLSIGTMYPVDQFIVNLMSSGGGKRYLKTSIALELSVSEMTAELDTKRDIIRDVLITILSSKTFEEVQTSKGKQKLKEEIIERLNEFLVDGRVANVFFTEFVVQ